MSEDLIQDGALSAIDAEYKYDAEFGSAQEEETRERLTSTVVGICECIKGVVLDSGRTNKTRFG
jgi:hypothetical protein